MSRNNNQKSSGINTSRVYESLYDNAGCEYEHDAGLDLKESEYSRLIGGRLTLKEWMSYIFLPFGAEARRIRLYKSAGSFVGKKNLYKKRTHSDVL